MIDFNQEVMSASNADKILKDEGGKAKRDALYYVPFEKLVILPDFNVREHDSKWESRVRSLADDMVANGYLPSKPMEVFVNSDGRIIVTDGHTRHAGVTLARSEAATNLDQIPVIPCRPGTTMEDLTVNLVRSNSGEKLSPLAISLVVKRLVYNYGKTSSEAARAIGISAAYAGQLLLLAGAPHEIRQMVMNDQISATFAIQMLQEHGADALKVLQEGADEAKAKGKKRITKKHTGTPANAKEKEIARQATTLFQLIELMMVDRVLSKDLGDKFESILHKINEASEEEEENV